MLQRDVAEWLEQSSSLYTHVVGIESFAHVAKWNMPASLTICSLVSSGLTHRHNIARSRGILVNDIGQTSLSLIIMCLVHVVTLRP